MDAQDFRVEIYVIQLLFKVTFLCLSLLSVFNDFMAMVCAYYRHWITSLSAQEALLGFFRVARNAPTERGQTSGLKLYFLY